MSIPQFPADTAPDEVTAALEESGCVVVTGLMDIGPRQAIKSELAPHMDSVRVIEQDGPCRILSRSY